MTQLFPRCYKTRMAPTPSGFLHLGNVFSFIITRSMARHTGASMLLRIDDIDRDRVKPEYVTDLFDTLHFLGISWDEGPRTAEEYYRDWSQLNRLARYQQVLRQLRGTGAAFACDCSRADLHRAGIESGCVSDCRRRKIALDTPGTNWRIATDHQQTVCINNPDGHVSAHVLPASVKDFIVRKKDGLPSYQLVSLVDDVDFGIDLVVRGHDLWPSTLAQVYLANLLGIETFPVAKFVHHPLVNGPGGVKLSKSAGDTAIRNLREQGFTREQVLEMAIKSADPAGLAFPL
ncbi:glutamate--tRNA ligase family protein [Hufsiella ginkgonis]|uniref:tRNA glutamyl-Q synthetase n=1 Tax=Hufsiella ginkgonis TaxID=2695274 RepID=A0A7K1XUU4_9SPHI|nr:glutamate--tRNA ligase family protein [Hufsiella ginkgonis]MXV14783.1 tRNA glutamyl-Q synthetase [Hufsiella ginkgonis]